ncbi:hypothetical protein SPHV1_1550007 [Novosphingobium sp. KN65.2]|nr:hypothetical protein SPHV1_1550007 [Novosphingobium sp. KN65.2]
MSHPPPNTSASGAAGRPGFAGTNAPQREQAAWAAPKRLRSCVLKAIFCDEGGRSVHPQGEVLPR